MNLDQLDDDNNDNFLSKLTETQKKLGSLNPGESFKECQPKRSLPSSAKQSFTFKSALNNDAEDDEDCDALWSMFDINDLDEGLKPAAESRAIIEPDDDDMLSGLQDKRDVQGLVDVNSLHTPPQPLSPTCKDGPHVKKTASASQQDMPAVKEDKDLGVSARAAQGVSESGDERTQPPMVAPDDPVPGSLAPILAGSTEETAAIQKQDECNEHKFETEGSVAGDITSREEILTSEGAGCPCKEHGSKMNAEAEKAPPPEGQSSEKTPLEKADERSVQSNATDDMPEHSVPISSRSASLLPEHGSHGIRVDDSESGFVPTSSRRSPNDNDYQSMREPSILPSLKGPKAAEQSFKGKGTLNTADIENVEGPAAKTEAVEPTHAAMDSTPLSPSKKAADVEASESQPTAAQDHHPDDHKDDQANPETDPCHMPSPQQPQSDLDMPAEDPQKQPDSALQVVGHSAMDMDIDADFVEASSAHATNLGADMTGTAALTKAADAGRQDEGKDLQSDEPPAELHVHKAAAEYMDAQPADGAKELSEPTPEPNGNVVSRKSDRDKGEVTTSLSLPFEKGPKLAYKQDSDSRRELGELAQSPQQPQHQHVTNQRRPLQPLSRQPKRIPAVFSRTPFQKKETPPQYPQRIPSLPKEPSLTRPPSQTTVNRGLQDSAKSTKHESRGIGCMPTSGSQVQQGIIMPRFATQSRKATTSMFKAAFPKLPATKAEASARPFQTMAESGLARIQEDGESAHTCLAGSGPEVQQSLVPGQEAVDVEMTMEADLDAGPNLDMEEAERLKQEGNALMHSARQQLQQRQLTARQFQTMDSQLERIKSEVDGIHFKTLELRVQTAILGNRIIRLDNPIIMARLDGLAAKLDEAIAA